MKSKLLALTALLTFGFAVPATAQPNIDFGVTVGDRAGIVIIPSRRRDRDYHPRYRGDWDRRPRYRLYRPDDYGYYGYDRFYDPYRSGRRSRHRYRHRGYYYPRGNSIQLRIGF